VGCKFSASNTKRDAAMLAEFLERHITIEHPINIHFTGCHHSCAQHYAADIGLLATKIEQDDDMVEGYDLLVGGGAGPDQRLGRLIRPKVVTDALPPMLLALLTAWQEQRQNPDEAFQAFANRHSELELAALTERLTVEA
jgi:ferredoxin-nitrite reductase